MKPKCSSVANEIVRYMKLLVELGLNTLTSGNISGKCYIGNTEFIVLTPSGIDKTLIEVQDLVIYDTNNARFYGNKKPTSEYRMHIDVYARNRNVWSVAHAHNPFSLIIVDKIINDSDTSGGYLYESQRSLAEKRFNSTNLVEADYVAGKICVVEPLTPGSAELASRVAEASSKCDALVLNKHGVVSFGKSVMQATERLIAVEYLSRYIYFKDLIGHQGE